MLAKDLLNNAFPNTIASDMSIFIPPVASLPTRNSPSFATALLHLSSSPSVASSISDISTNRSQFVNRVSISSAAQTLNELAMSHSMVLNQVFVGEKTSDGRGCKRRRRNYCSIGKCKKAGGRGTRTAFICSRCSDPILFICSEMCLAHHRNHVVEAQQTFPPRARRELCLHLSLRVMSV